MERGRWGRCEDDTPEPPAPAPVSRGAEEPRTGVVRRLNPPRERSREAQRTNDSGDWRCLEAWSQPSKVRRSRRNAKVTIVQLSKNGDLIRQNGPDAWLPEAGDFVQRMSRLLAQSLGFERCRSLCLKGQSSALSITEAGDSKIVAVSGPSSSMANVLRRAGIE
jgi:hypothetical protein